MTNHALRNALLALALAATLPACTTMDVRSDSAAAANLSACHTYGWMDSAAIRPDAFGNPLNERRLRDAIAQRLQGHGMTLAASGTADCQVGYAFGSRDDYDRARWSFGVGVGSGWPGPGWGRRGAGSIYWDGAPYAVRENRVSVDLFRNGGPAGAEPLWHASVEMDLTRLTGAEAEQRIDAAVAAMFAKYPAAR